MNRIFQKWIFPLWGIGLVAFLLCACKKRIADRPVVTHYPFQAVPEGDWGLLRADEQAGAEVLFPSAPSVVVGGRFSVADSCGRRMLYKWSDEGKAMRMGSEAYAQLGHFFGRRTVAQLQPGGPFCLLDKEGRYVATLEESEENPVERVHNFSEGWALVKWKQGKYGYIDEEGQTVIPPQYDFASDLSGGVALVGVADRGRQSMVYYILHKHGRRRVLVRLQQCDLSARFVGGVLAYRERTSGRCGLLDEEGQTVMTFPEGVKAVLPSMQGVALFLDENGVGLADEKGKVLIPGIYEKGKVLADDRVAFRLHGKWGMLDFSGKVWMGFTCDSISACSDDHYVWAYKEGKCTRIGRDGQSAGGETYRQVLTDRSATGEVPQVFWRMPAVAVASAAAEPEEPEKADGELSTVAGRAAEPVDEAAAQAESRENPFFEEAKKIYAGKLEEPDARRRKVILDYVERFRAAYTQKDLPFIEQVFSEEALIVVGKVVKKAQQPVEGNYLSGPEVQYNVKSKKEYLARLKEVFRANKRIRVSFSDFKIMRHPTRENFYGVTMRQGYASDIYSDDGYLFLLWDFSDEEAPKIHVRTWQPSMLDANTPLPIEKVFSIRDFNFE